MKIFLHWPDFLPSCIYHLPTNPTFRANIIGMLYCFKLISASDYHTAIMKPFHGDSFNFSQIILHPLFLNANYFLSVFNSIHIIRQINHIFFIVCNICGNQYIFLLSLSQHSNRNKILSPDTVCLMSSSPRTGMPDKLPVNYNSSLSKFCR